MDAQKLSSAELTAWLDGTQNRDHNFSAYFNADETARVVAFIQKGIVDYRSFLGADGKSSGNVSHGKVLFTSICTICHGEDGKMINFMADENGFEFVGTVANEDPYALLHVATVGFPGEPMPAALNLGWSAQDIADVLAWAQTLPTK